MASSTWFPNKKMVGMHLEFHAQKQLPNLVLCIPLSLLHLDLQLMVFLEFCSFHI